MFKKSEAKPFVSVVIVASGNSTRMGENKLLMPIFDTPVIAKTVSAFANIDEISEIILVCRQEDMLIFSKLCEEITSKVKIVNGSKTRTLSTQNGLNACSKQANYIGIHDGARPLITEEIILNVLQKSIETNACIPVVAVKDTIKCVENDVCVKNLNRDLLFAVQTPQFFEANLITQSTTKGINLGFNYTDDSACVEHFGATVHTVNGSYENIKITTIDDIALAHKIIESRGF